MALEDIDFRMLSEKDLDSVIDFTAKHFAKNEPISKCLGLIDNEKTAHFFDPYVKLSLPHNISIGAYDKKTDELVAIRVSYLGKNIKDEEKKEEDSELPLCMRQFVKVFEYVLKDDPIGTKNHLMLFLMCTREDYGGRGIATEFYRRSEEIAINNDCSKILTLATSQYTFLIGGKRGYKIVREFCYQDYVDPITEKKILKNVSAPHTNCRLIMKDLK